ncbi:HlyD family secretion protein [Pollutibacter soli]|uniref:HlyD family secretion protein n=1 Tax=Pollutibacter soli TaxID=3034157 RepID=UPI003013E533
MKKLSYILLSVIILSACSNNKDDFDASGTFEADEVIVSSQQAGQILSLQIKEGQQLNPGQTIGNIDVTNLELQKQQTEARIKSLGDRLNTATPQTIVIENQIAVLKTQIAYLEKEQERTTNLLKADAATRKQLDDITAKVDEAKRQLEVYQQQIALNKSNVNVQNKSVMSEKDPLEKSVAQIQDLISKGNIVNPIKGTVLTQYAFTGELANIGKPLYKIANLDTIILRAYISGNQLAQVKLGQKVNVKSDDGKGGFKPYNGIIYWVSSKAEFTPKTVQTKEERQDLVYAIKVAVPNDGFLKIGMYGELNF